MKREGLTGEVIAEFLGTMIFIILGNGVIAQVMFQTRGDSNWNTIALGWGLGLAMAVYVAGGVTGAHLNPAITLAAIVTRGMDWVKGIAWMAAQLAGAFVGSFLVHMWYFGSFVEQGDKNVFFTSPASADYSMINTFFGEVVGSFLFVLFIWAIIKNMRSKGSLSNMAPLMMGLALLAVGLTVGGPTLFALNPARDLGPRIYAAVAKLDIVAFGKDIEAGIEYTYWWIPIVGPLVGGVLGALCYDHVILPFLAKKEK
jgi:glycerol uptake facilitator protein